MHDVRNPNQNLGNRLGNRPCVKLSENYRRLLSGNAAKELLGHSSLVWNEGSYVGSRSTVREPARDSSVADFKIRKPGRTQKMTPITGVAACLNFGN